jgi:hypothetical protein
MERVRKKTNEGSKMKVRNHDRRTPERRSKGR